MNLSDLQEIKHSVDYCHVYQSDQSRFGKPEHWESFHKIVNRGERFYGDCDDYCLTVANLIIKQFQNPDDVRLALVNTGSHNNAAFDHVVCLVRIHGIWYVVDNRRPIQKQNETAYRWYAFIDLPLSSKWTLYQQGVEFDKTGAWE